jgi:hypothetical protein
MESEKVDLIDAAYTIRYHLDDLLEPEQAKAMKQDLDKALEECETGEPDVTKIMEILRRYPKTRQWIRFIDNRTEEVSLVKNYSDLAGFDPDAPKSSRYVCPEQNCPQRWFRWKPGLEVPVCIVHDVRLVPESKKADGS